MRVKREIWLDYVRAIACMLVVLLHTSAPYLYKIQTIPMSSWHVGNYVDSFTRISVPLFFMISGYLFFGEKKPHLKNYIRIIIALIFYSSIALLYIRFYVNSPVWILIKGLAFRPVFYHLWFFYTIFVVYIFGLFLSVRILEANHIIVLFLVCFIVINPRLSNVTGLFGTTFQSRMHLDGNIIYYVLYAIFGAMFGKVQFEKYWVNSFLAPLLYVAASVAIGYSTYTVSVEAGKYIGTYYHYNGILVAIGAISVFLFIKENAKNFSKFDKPINVISRNSLAIYGVHALILDFIKREQYRDYNNPFFDIPVVFLVTFLMSLVIAIAIKYCDRHKLVT